ncbi:alpha/beta hydrolase fold domain-containing protein [Alloscardovia omnicolens]|uniref:alpha/beta hydrolase fold domain-containing protein n=1 Tax=Alloscardovia omnicolens TaxID=419015 RepID=UPI003A6D500E
MARRSGFVKLLAGAAALAGAAWAFDKYAQKKHQRSGVSLAINTGLELYPKRSAQQEMAWLDENKNTERTDAGVPGIMLKSGLASVYDDGNDAELDTFGMTTYRIAPKDFSRTIAPHTTVIFAHGGGYVQGINPTHLLFLSRFARQCGVTVLVPDYDPAPYGTAADAFRQITGLYTTLRAKNPEENVILMGDSAGAGMIFGLALEWAQNGIQAPEGIIAISPWVDATLSNPEIEAYISRDPMLDVDRLHVDANAWSGTWNVSDPRISPARGNLSALKDTDVTLLVGTNEIFFPDVTDFAQRLTAAGVRTKLHIGENMIHDYPMLPIPEAAEPMNQIEMAVIEAVIK